MWLSSRSVECLQGVAARISGLRAELVEPLKEAGGLVRLGVVCEILDVEGVPPGALLAAASLVRPFSLLVVGRMTGATAASMERIKGAGLQALSFECPQGLGDCGARLCCPLGSYCDTGPNSIYSNMCCPTRE